MNQDNKSYRDEKSESKNDSDEIDLINLLKIFFRNKNLIALITLLICVGGLIRAFTIKKVWEGNFQIVLTSENKLPRQIKPGGTLEYLFMRRDDPLMTEVSILKSPLVLNKVFEYVKENKYPKDVLPPRSFTFNEWKKNSLKVELEKGTTILNIVYKDQDKDSILKILNKISQSYQQYSGRKRLRNIQLAKDYFDKQISDFKQKSKTSLNAVQEYAIKNELLFFNGEIDKDVNSSINIENIRVISANNIRNLEIQLSQLKEKDNYEKVKFMLDAIPEYQDNPIVKELNSTEKKIAFSRKKYKDSDISIIKLIKERDLFINLLNKELENFLIAKLSNENAKLESSNRPEGVLIKYRQLLEEASKDKSTLGRLENQYRELLLEEARTEDPWELITTPTLGTYPVAPNKRKILYTSLIIGLASGSAIALILEKKKNIMHFFQ